MDGLVFRGGLGICFVFGGMIVIELYVFDDMVGWGNGVIGFEIILGKYGMYFLVWIVIVVVFW